MCSVDDVIILFETSSTTTTTTTTGQLYYIMPGNGMWFTQNKTDGDNAEKVGLRDHLVEDFHVGAGGAVAGSKELFANDTHWHEGSVNLETNAGTHTMDRECSCMCSPLCARVCVVSSPRAGGSHVIYNLCHV